MKIIIANWKMNGTLYDLEKYFDYFLSKYEKTDNKIIFCIPYVFLQEAIKITKDSDIDIYAQNCHYEESGPFTGEISYQMLKSIGVKGSIIGHSEVKENSDIINKKIRLLSENNMNVIFCVGESFEERINKDFVIRKQIYEGLKNIKNLKNILIAYEPVWAIGSNIQISLLDIRYMVDFIKKTCNELNYENSKVLYGGSVNKQNTTKILSIVDGILVGKKSLDPKEFLNVINEKGG